MGIFECGFLGLTEKHVTYRKYRGEVSILSNPPRYRYYRIGIDTFAITNFDQFLQNKFFHRVAQERKEWERRRYTFALKGPEVLSV